MHASSFRATWLSLALVGLWADSARPQDPPAKDATADKTAQNPAKSTNPNLPDLYPKRPGPDPIPAVALGPVLPTHPIARTAPGPSWIAADAAALPKDRKGIWILDFAFKPVRMIDVDLPGKGRRRVHYMYYRVVNRTGKPRMFVPQFTLVADSGKRYEDVVLPQAVKNIQAREDPTKELLGAVSIMGIIPPSTKEGVDDAVYGVAIWDDVDYKADSFKVFVRGLSDGYQNIQPPDGAKPYTRYKALRADFTRPGDEHKPNEREIRIADPAYEWAYYP
ncbi:MAG: hypothetical protein JWN86_368 [Planctomycetota bacterium]|nr:hypothetical protein [Planctomycetota bacterium]